MATRGGFDDAAMESLGSFVPRVVSEWMAADPRQLHRRLLGSLVSADLSGFTALSESLAREGKVGAEQLTLAVNACFSRLIASAEAEGGDVLKFGGDALLLLFDGDEHEVRAFRASTAMQAALDDRRLRAFDLRMSVGIHSGPIDLFLVGSPVCYLVVAGPAATNVARLEARAEVGEIAVSAATQAALDAGAAPPRPAPAPGPRRPSSEVPLDELLPRGVRELLAALDTTGGEHRLAAIAFCGIDGIDERLDRLGPESVAAELDELVSAIEATAADTGVTLLDTDVMVDGVKFVLAGGAPVSTGDDEDALLRSVHHLVNGHWPAPMRAGVHRGRVFAGFVGGASRRTYTVMGDPVNLAARLLGRAGAGELLASNEVMQRARSAFASIELPPFRVKGKRDPVTAVLVGELTVDREPTWVEHLPLVGRDGEMATIGRALDDIGSGRGGRVIELVGEAGIGKTRLVRAALDDPRPHRRVLVECQPYDRSTPYATARQLLRAALGIELAAAPTDAGQRLTTWVADAAPDLVPLLPLLAVPLGATVGASRAVDEIAPEFRAARTYDAVADLLCAALTEQTLVVIEDAYFMDDASQQLLRRVLRDVGQRPWAVLATNRPDGQPLVEGDHEDHHRFRVQPLDASACAALVASSPFDTGLSDAAVARLTDRSAGNPLFVLELLAASPDIAESDLPETIERLIAARIDQLQAKDRLLLRHAAVIGRVFAVDVLQQLLDPVGYDASDLRSWVRMGEFIEPQGRSEFRFRHVLYREVAYEGLPFNRRRTLHERAGDLLQERALGGEAVDDALLSLHYWLGGRYQDAWRYSVAVGDSARANHAVVEATEAYQRALDAARRVRGLPAAAVATVAEALGDMEVLRPRYDRATKAYERARRAAGDVVHHQARLLRKRGQLSELESRYGQALRWYRRAMQRLGDDPTDPLDIGELAEIEIAYAGVLYRKGQKSAVAEWRDRARAHGAAVGDQRVMGYADLHSLLMISEVATDLARAEALAASALANLEPVGDLPGQAKTVNNLGVAYYFAGLWDEAVPRYERAGELFARAGDVYGTALARNNIGEVRSDQGHFVEADRLLSDAYRQVAGTGATWIETVILSNVGRVAVRRGEVVKGREIVEGCHAALVAMGSASFAFEAAARLVEADVIEGDAESAVRRATVLLGRVGADEPDHATVVNVHRCLGWARLQLGDHEASLEAFRTALRLAERGRLRYEEALTLRGLATLAARTGDPRGEAHALEAAWLLEGLGVVALPEIPLSP